MPSDDPDRKESTAAIWARYSHIGFMIPAGVLAGYFLGKLFDYWLHTRWLFLVGVIVGAVAGFMDVIRTVTRDSK